MDVANYLEQRAIRKREEKSHRKVCWTCRQAGFGCFCEFVKPFDPQIQFVILIHPHEAKRRIATGRMAHLCLKNSSFIQGSDFSENKDVRDILESKENHCVVLYPGRNSLNLTMLSTEQKSALVPPNKKLVIFVIDGTWNTARHMIRSKGLFELPRVSFEPNRRSTFRVRKQPAPECLSTIEAIHHTIDLINPMANREHDRLLDVFDSMVEFQLRFTEPIGDYLLTDS